MRKIFHLFFVLLFTGITAQAQFGYAGTDEIIKLKKTTTYVVLSDSNQVFNNYMRSAVENHWKISKYEFIPFSELENHSKDEGKSFLLVSGLYVSNGTLMGPTWEMLTNFYTRPSSVRTTGQRVNYGTIVLTVQFGGKKFNNHYNQWMLFCYGGINASGFSSAKTISYIQLMHKSFDIIQKRNLKKLKWGEAKDEFNTGKLLNNKTLVLWEKDIPTVSHTGKEDKKFLNKREIEEKFGGKFKIVNNEELEKLLESKSDEYLYFGSFVEGTFNVIYLYDAEGNIHYYDQLGRMMGDCTFWFNAVLKNLNKAFQA